MISSIDDDFKEFVEKISLNCSLENDVLAKYNGLRELLKKDYPRDIEENKLSGSYAKGTVINEYCDDAKPDIDMIIILKEPGENIEKLRKELYSYLVTKKDYIADIRIQSNSIRLQYKNVDVDIVIGRKKQNNQLEIAMLKKEKWIESNCLKHVDYMESQKRNYHYKSLVKVIKYINKNIVKAKIKSYTIEMLIHKCSPTGDCLELPEAILSTLENIRRVHKVEDIRDCCDSQKAGYDNKDIKTFDHFKEEIAIIEEELREGLAGNRQKLKDIFGEKFPAQPKEKLGIKGQFDDKHTPYCN